MTSILRIIPISLLLTFLLVTTSKAQFAGGSGTALNPWEISTLADLQQMGDYLGDYYELVNDIDASDTENWNSGVGFLPIEYLSMTFDGNGYVITGLFINLPDSNFVGLFRGSSNGAEVLDLGLEDVNITGKDYVGGIIGLNNGEVSTSYTTGVISGGEYVGGILGQNKGTIENTYSIATVTADSAVGGISGDNKDSIIDSYSSGIITGNSDTGGLSGTNSGTVTTSYWDKETSGITTSDGGTGVTSLGMVKEDSLNGFNFSNTWDIDEGLSYPFFQWEGASGDHNKPIEVPSGLVLTHGNTSVTLSWNSPIYNTPDRFYIYRDSAIIDSTLGNEITFTDTGLDNWTEYSYFLKALYDKKVSVMSSQESETPYPFESGSGDVNDPWEITTPEQLDSVRNHLDGHFILTEDLDLSMYSGSSGGGAWNGGLGWRPIGFSGNLFTGSFNGKGHIISGVYINMPENWFVGLFSNVVGSIDSLGLVDASIVGGTVVGGIAGKTTGSGTVSNSFVSGSISGSDDIIGGVLGENFGMLSNNYSTAEVEGEDRVGGLVGYHRSTGTIEYSYSSGEVTGDTNFGGLVGLNESGIVTSNYWDSLTSNQSSSDAGSALTTEEMVQESSFASWDFSSVWSIDQGTTYPFHKWQSSSDEYNIPLQIPEGFTSEAGNKEAKLTWNIPDLNTPDGYNLYRDSQKINEIILTDTSYTDTGLTNRTSYSYHVTAIYNNRETVLSEETEVTPIYFTEQEGTTEDPWHITSVEDLDSVRFYLDGNFFLTTNLDLDVSPYNIGEGWKPIGKPNGEFTGSFNGGGFVVSNLYINRSGQFQIGLFRAIGAGGVVDSLNLESVDVTVGSNSGVLSGYVLIGGTISNSSVHGVLSGESTVGGLIGVNSGTIEKSFTDIEATGIMHIGGLTGINAGTIEESFSTGTVTGNDIIGGITGNVNSVGTLLNTYSTADVSGTVRVGGLAGLTYGTITKSYSTGRVSGNTDIGGLTGVVGSYAEFNDSFWNIETSLADSSDGGDSLTTFEMLNEASFTNWDFGSVWDIDEGTSYPYLIWQSVSQDFNLPDSVLRPTRLEVDSVGNSQYIELTWWAPSLGGVEEYNVYRDSILIHSGTDTIYQDTVPQYFTEYEYYVTATYSDGEDEIESSSSNTELITLALEAPGNLEGIPGTLSVTLTWSAPPTLVPDGYNVYRDSVLINTGSLISDTTYTDSSIPSPGTYTYFISSVYEHASESEIEINAAEVSVGPYGILPGSGTLADPWQLTKPEDFLSVYANPDSNFILTEDIDLTYDTSDPDGIFFNEGKGWLPIGQVTSSFDGTFNGKGYIISGLASNRSSEEVESVLGFFGLVSGTVDSLALEDVSINGNGYTYTGGIAGANLGHISNSYVTGIIGSSGYVGGVTGVNSNSLSNLFTSTEINGQVAGGILGGALGGTVENVFATDIVTGTLAGGIYGSELSTTTFTNSYWNISTSGITTSPKGTGLMSSQMLDFTNFSGFDFENTWDIYEGHSFPFLRNIGSYRTSIMEIDGDEGWRIMSSPVDSISYDSLLKDLWTQGFTGADNETGVSNVYTWNESIFQYESISNATDIPEAGKGFIVYVFDDQDNDQSADGFPKSLMIEGNQMEETASPFLSYTNTGDSNSDGWNLVGNPYAFSLNWAAGLGWTQSNIDASFYVWNAADGEYQSHNGIAGTLPDSSIAPGQGFWVKANSSDPVLSLTHDVRSGDGVLLKKKSKPLLKLLLEGGELSSKATIMFSELATLGKDHYDAFKLAPLATTYLSLGIIQDTLASMDIQALPLEFDLIELGLDIKASALEGDFVLSWENLSIPENWEVLLFDEKTNEQIDMSQKTVYEFKIDSVVSKATKPISKLIPSKPIQLITKRKTEEPRLNIRISSSSSVSINPTIDLPTEVELGQNYPNPFNPSTTIAYGVPNTGKVTLEVFDILGRKVATLLNGENKTAGRYTLHFNASNLASGMYIYRLRVGNIVMIKKFTLIK